MEKLTAAVKSINFVELMLMMSIFVALMIRYFDGYQSVFFLEVFSFGLAAVYFPFGFYFVKKPSQNYSNTICIILGFIYALGVLTILISAVNIDSYRYPLILDFSIFIALIIYMLFKLRSAAYPEVFINTQFIRIAFIMVCSFVVLVK
jgi:hypothetical protein